ncbi:MAG: hypothetical protein M3Y56_03905 [Armatimonadota bacterium]|nr:hypothetical protein [Armatimonadota bacterium]
MGPAPDHRCVLLGSLLWSVVVLLAVPWMLGERTNSPTPAPVKPSGVVVQSAASPLIASRGNANSDHIDLSIRIPGNRWVDTGINICGCTNIHISTSGAWKTPFHILAGAAGGNSSVQAQRYALTTGAPYGSLVARVGISPFLYIGSSRQVNGSQFNDTGTLKLGMNARSGNSSSGSITVHITGTGDRDHEVRFCAFPR